EVAVAKLRLEGLALPQLERVGRLDVEMAVTEDGRCPVARRRLDLADRERLSLPVDELRLPAGLAHEVADPLPRLGYVTGMRRVGADRRDAQELRQLVEPLRAHRAAETNGRPRSSRLGPAR